MIKTNATHYDIAKDDYSEEEWQSSDDEEFHDNLRRRNEDRRCAMEDEYSTTSMGGQRMRKTQRNETWKEAPKPRKRTKEEWQAAHAISRRTSEKRHLDFEKKPELSGDKSRLLETVKPAISAKANKSKISHAANTCETIDEDEEMVYEDASLHLEEPSDPFPRQWKIIHNGKLVRHYKDYTSTKL